MSDRARADRARLQLERTAVPNTAAAPGDTLPRLYLSLLPRSVRMAYLWPFLCYLSSINIEILLGRPSTPGKISLAPPHEGIIQFDNIMAECVLLACPPRLEAEAGSEPVPVHGKLRLMALICLLLKLQALPG